MDILRGISDGDWGKIRQIVMEIHDPTREALKRAEELLSGKGFRCAVVQETLLEHAGLFNLYAIRDEAFAVDAARPAAASAGCLQRNVRDFCDAVRAFMSESAAPLLLCVCPRTPAAADDPQLGAALDAAEQSLLADVSAIANVHPIGSAPLARRYPLKDYYDPYAHHAGHIPYTPEC